MAKQVKQFRYYCENSEKNYPAILLTSGGSLLVTGEIFSDYQEITLLGILALPGTCFYLNNSNYPIIIGNTGIYELDVDGMAVISAIRFDLDSIRAINNSSTTYLIIDIVYDDMED